MSLLHQKVELLVDLILDSFFEKKPCSFVKKKDVIWIYFLISVVVQVEFSVQKNNIGGQVRI